MILPKKTIPEGAIGKMYVKCVREALTFIPESGNIFSVKMERNLFVPSNLGGNHHG